MNSVLPVVKLHTMSGFCSLHTRSHTFAASSPDQNKILKNQYPSIFTLTVQNYYIKYVCSTQRPMSCPIMPLDFFSLSNDFFFELTVVSADKLDNHAAGLFVA